MVPPHVALLFWAALTFALGALRPGYKAATWGFLGAMFFLPANVPESFQLPGVPVLSKAAAFTYGLLPATILFHRDGGRRLARRDLLLGLLLAAVGWTILRAGFTPYDAASVAFSYAAELVLPLLLLRWHLRTPAEGLYFLRSFFWLTVFYTPLLIWEWRMSPQLHTTVYGYFPHMFLQMVRGSFFRPVVFFGHALELGYVYALAFLLGLGLRREERDRVPVWALAAVALGLLTTLSLGPWLFALIGAALWGWTRRRRLPAWLPLVPLALLGVCIYLCEDRTHFAPIVDFFRRLSPERADSLDYRLYAFEVYIRNILAAPVWGHGTFGRGRIEGVATDAAVLVRLLAFGLVFSSCFYGWVLAELGSLRRRVNESGTVAAGRRAVDGVAAALFWGLWLAVAYDFIVEGTMLLVLGVSMAYRGPASRKAEPDSPGAAAEETGVATFSPQISNPP